MSQSYDILSDDLANPCQYNIDFSPGERLELYREKAAPENLGLSIYAEEEPGIFTVQKVSQDLIEPIPEAAAWMLEGDRATIGRRTDGFLTEVLITPSMLGYGLYGMRRSPSGTPRELRKPLESMWTDGQFGRISVGMIRSGMEEVRYPLTISLVPKMKGIGRVIVRHSLD